VSATTTQLNAKMDINSAKAISDACSPVKLQTAL
jgi:hypothetical protein